jgi:hypothetical protein
MALERRQRPSVEELRASALGLDDLRPWRPDLDQAIQVDEDQDDDQAAKLRPYPAGQPGSWQSRSLATRRAWNWFETVVRNPTVPSVQRMASRWTTR